MPPSHRHRLCRCSSCPSPVSVQINISLLHLQNHQNFPHSAVFEHEDTDSGAGQGQRRYLEDRSCHCAIGDRTAVAVGLRSPRPGRLRWPWSRLAPFSARPRASTPYAPYLLVIVWLLNERALSQTRFQAGLSKVAEDAFLDLVRADAARIARIRYPGVIRVIQTLNESKNVIAMVTEPIYASVSNALCQADNISLVPKELKGMSSNRDASDCRNLGVTPQSSMSCLLSNISRVSETSHGASCSRFGSENNSCFCDSKCFALLGRFGFNT